MKAKKTKKIEVRITAQEFKNIQAVARAHFGGNVSLFLRKSLSDSLAYHVDNAARSAGQKGAPYEAT